jgi:hypothetical protein
MTEHLDSTSLARYLGGAGTSGERARWEAHLSECAECREEMVEVRRILATAPDRRRAYLIPLTAAAAALLVVWAGTVVRHPLGDVTRDPDSSVTVALAPRPLAPLGVVSPPDDMLWSAVPGVTRYRVTLFTSEGRAAWQTTTSDTFATLPDTLRLPLATPNYWQVKGETGFGRWVESELVAFSIRRDPPR